MVSGPAKKRIGLLWAGGLLVSMALGASAAPVQRAVLDSPERDACFLDLIDGRVPATDSAAAATAMLTGTETDAGNVTWLLGDPPGGELVTIAEKLRAERGFAIGAASTVPFNHATPARFVSHNATRGNKQLLANEIIFEVAPELVIGGGYEDSHFPLDSAEYISLTMGLSDYTTLWSAPAASMPTRPFQLGLPLLT